MKIAYKIATQEELNKLNEWFYQHYPEDRNLKWSGCNYHINIGKYEYEPLGTAQSVHECTYCEEKDSCQLKSDTPIWFWNEDIEKKLERIYMEMSMRQEQNQL